MSPGGMGVYDYKIRGLSKRFADITYSIGFRRKVFVLSAKVSSP